jgi:hypothetical protein
LPTGVRLSCTPDILFIWLKFARGRVAYGNFSPATVGKSVVFAGSPMLRRRTRVNHWASVGLSGEGVKYLLHVLILFELVDHGQNFSRLFFR